MKNQVGVCGKPVGPGNPTFVIAEAGINHDGEMAIATRLVQEAKKAGADAIKFQTFTAAGLMTRSSGVAAHLDAGAGRENVYEFCK